MNGCKVTKLWQSFNLCIYCNEHFRENIFIKGN